jgi:hypothetical protein
MPRVGTAGYIYYGTRQLYKSLKLVKFISSVLLWQYSALFHKQNELGKVTATTFHKSDASKAMYRNLWAVTRCGVEY